MIFIILQIIVSVLLIACVLLQMKGSGLSASFGGAGEMYRSRRSVERFLVWVTIVLATLFAILSIILLINHN